MPLLWISAAFLAGVFLASRLALPWPVWGALAALGVGLGVLELRLPFLSGWRKRWRSVAPIPVGFLLAALLAGAARYQAARPVFDQNDLAAYNGQGEVRFSAMVVEPPNIRERSIQLRLSAEEILAVNGAPVSIPASGLALATLPPGGDWHYGDRLELSGELVDPPESESFSYRAYLARQGVYTTINYPSIRRLERGAGNVFLTGIYAFRHQAYRVVNRLYPQPEAALLSGIVLGIEQDIPDSWRASAIRVRISCHLRLQHCHPGGGVQLAASRLIRRCVAAGAIWGGVHPSFGAGSLCGGCDGNSALVRESP